MRNKLLLSTGGLLTAACAVIYSLLFLTGISPETGLVTNSLLLWLTCGLSAALIVFWFAAAFFLLDAPLKIREKRPADKEKKEKQKRNKEKKKEKEPPRPIDPLMITTLPKHAAPFYAAFLFILMAAVLFLFLQAARDFSAFHLAIAIFALLALAAFIRAAILHMTVRPREYDAFLLPAPIIFACLFSIFTYQKVAKMPQASAYFPEMMALIGFVMGFYLFLTHFFGSPARRAHLFAALLETSFGSILYIEKLVSLFSAFFSSEIVSAGDYFTEVASLMVYAASAVLGAVYTMLLFRPVGKKEPQAAEQEP